MPPRFWSAFATVSSLVQVIGFITMAPGSTTGSGVLRVGETVLKETITWVSSAPVANFSSGFCARYSGVIEYPGTYAAIIRL